MNDEEFASKVDYEGGLFDATFGYGLNADSLSNTDGELYAAMVEYDKWREASMPIINRVLRALPEDYGTEDY